MDLITATKLHLLSHYILSKQNCSSYNIMMMAVVISRMRLKVSSTATH